MSKQYDELVERSAAASLDAHLWSGAWLAAPEAERNIERHIVRAVLAEVFRTLQEPWAVSSGYGDTFSEMLADSPLNPEGE